MRAIPGRKTTASNLETEFTSWCHGRVLDGSELSSSFKIVGSCLKLFGLGSSKLLSAKVQVF